MIYQYLFLAAFMAIGAVLGYFVRWIVASKKVDSVEQKIKSQLEEANAKSKEIILEAQEKATGLLEEVKKEEREQKIQIARSEERIINKEESLEKKWSELKEQENQLKENTDKIKVAQARVIEEKEGLVKEFEKISKMTEAEARERLFEDVKSKYKDDLASAVIKLSKERQEELEKKSVEIMTTAIQRLARSYVSEATTTVFHIDEDMKGKIIGREGRNIRALERATGAEFIIDETPGTIIISSFDPVRRETARLALDKLIKDGRIQPAKIEEKAEEAKNEINKRMTEKGEEAAYEVGIYNLPKEIIQLLGRLYFRTSYGQNVLMHSVEAAHLATMMATELGLNIEVAKTGALLHDIGKAIDQEVGGKHVELGQKILRKFGIAESVIHAMEAHHEEYPFSIPESYVVAAADAISASRPGARRDTLENYLKRLEELEKIATSFEGIKNAYAISAGRELRIFVMPEKIDDFGAVQLAQAIANKIESELKYPGEIKVVVIRESKAVEYAR